ncbi:hypothetical protein DOE73_23285 [Paenibacillus dendritiformis]|nr:hypothetical protein DOE73_23285 [Paenibacillus dendritiformis]
MRGILRPYRRSSFGGAAAIDFTLQYPDRVNKLILVGPSVHGASYPFRLTWEGLMDYLRVRRLGIEAAGEIFMNKKFWSYLVPREESRKQQFKRLYIGKLMQEGQESPHGEARPTDSLALLQAAVRNHAPYRKPRPR